MDTNVLVAAFTARGLCSELFERVLYDHDLIISQHLLSEFEEVLVRKFGFTAAKVEQAVALLRRVGVMIEPVPLEHVRYAATRMTTWSWPWQLMPAPTALSPATETCWTFESFQERPHPLTARLLAPRR